MLQAIKTLAKDETVVIAIMKNNESLMMMIPAMTVKAIVSMISDQSGIDINPLVEDLCPNPDTRAAMALNCILVLKGKKPELPAEYKADRYSYNNRKLTYVSYSLTSNAVAAKTESNNIEMYDLQQWVGMPTEPKSK